MRDDIKIRVENLTMGYDEAILQRDISFSVRKGEVTVIMGPSGCGKSTLFRHMLGLHEPISGKVYYDDTCFTDSELSTRQSILRRCGVLYQSGALWSSMTVGENVALPLSEFTKNSDSEIARIVDEKLSMVGLKGLEKKYPAELSGGMRKRAGLARAIALNPEILFFDEPSAGLDPVTSYKLDQTILELKNQLGTTIIMVTHELPSIFTVADQSVYLDPDERRMTAMGNPHDLIRNPPNESVAAFLTRNNTDMISK